MQRALEAMKEVAELEAQLLKKAAQAKRIKKNVHFSQRVSPEAPLAIHVLEGGQFFPLDEDVQLDRILQCEALWIVPEGTLYCEQTIEVCNDVTIELDAADATHPARLGFKDDTSRNPPRYKLCHGASLNLCYFLGKTSKLGITKQDPYNNRGALVNELIDIWRSKNL